MLIEDLIRQYGLWAVFFGVMIEGDLTLLFAGVLAHYGLFSFNEALLTGTLGGFGIYSIFLVKYVYGLRTASAIFFGFAHMRFLRRFGPLTLLSCAAWAIALIGLGFTFSDAIDRIIGRFRHVGIVLLVALGIACAIALTLY